MERRLSAILAADVVGFSRLMEADEAGTFERLREHLKQLFEPEIAKHHGRIFKIMGDGLLAEFTSVVDAVECAVSLQRGMAERNQSVAEQERMQVRIGINLGEVIVEGDDRYGEGVNIAARLQQLAEPGGICVSDKVSKEVEKKLAFGFEPIGQQRVKNIAEPILVYRVNLSSMPRRRLARRGRSAIWPLAAIASIVLIVAAAVGTFVFSGLESQQLAGKPAIAVLPFASPGDEASARLGDGLTDDVITDLSRFRSIDVIARNSTEAYGSKPIDVRQIGKDLNINYVVVGSIQREGKQIRVTAQLIEATTGRNVWSDRWDRPTEDVFAVQSEIADAIARRLAEYGAITGAELAKAKRKPPQDLSAYELYLLGSDAQSSMTKEGMDKSIELISAALKRDPTLARAWVELGWARQQHLVWGR
jgi:class 3 adenylate cyclase/TolB-like protein